MASYLMYVQDQPRATARGECSEQVQKSSRATGNSKNGGSRTPSPIRNLWKGFKAGFRHSQERLDTAGEAAKDGERSKTTFSSPAGSRSGSTSPKRATSPVWASVKGAFRRNMKKMSSADLADASRTESETGQDEPWQCWRSDSSLQGSSKSLFSASLEASGVQLKTKASDGGAYIDPEDAMRVLECIDPKNGKFSPERALAKTKSPTRVDNRTEQSQQQMQSSYVATQTTQLQREHTAEPHDEWLREISTVSRNTDSMHRKAAEILEQKNRREGNQPQTHEGRRERHQTKEKFRAQLEATKAALQEQLNRITSEFDAALDEARARVVEDSPNQETARRGSHGVEGVECHKESSPSKSASSSAILPSPSAVRADRLQERILDLETELARERDRQRQ